MTNPRKVITLTCALSAAGQWNPEPSIITSNIDSFLRAYDGSESGNRTQAFERPYFDQASPDLRNFIRARIGSAAQLAAAVDCYPKYYVTIRCGTESVKEQRKLIGLYLTRFRRLYSDTKIPPSISSSDFSPPAAPSAIAGSSSAQ